MPYIIDQDRVIYDKCLEQILFINSKGDLEYCIYKLMKIYMQNKQFNFSNLHDTIYSAQHCADEFRRNYLDKRENDAKKTNGVIYPLLEEDTIC